MRIRRYYPLIGYTIEVVYSPNRYLKGIKGRVVMESGNMIYLFYRGRLVSIPKKGCIISVEYPEGRKILSFEDIRGSIVKRVGRL